MVAWWRERRAKREGRNEERKAVKVMVTDEKDLVTYQTVSSRQLRDVESLFCHGRRGEKRGGGDGELEMGKLGLSDNVFYGYTK